MSLWSDYLARKLIFDNHPSLNGSRCLNRLQRRRPCTACRDVCPEAAITVDDDGGPVPDWDACSGCGLCVSACPSRAVAPALLQTEKILSLLAPGGKTNFSDIHKDIIISCIDGPNDLFYLEFPGSLPWELLCFLALQGRLILITGDCESCEKTVCSRSLRQNVGLARQFFRTGVRDSSHSSVSDENIIVTRDPSSVPPRKYSRRQAFSLALKRTGQTAGFLLPSVQDSVPDGTVWRQLLMHRLEQMSQSGTGRSFIWALPAITGKCTACGICLKLCPCEAIMRVPGPEGSCRFYMALLPGKCTGCGICAEICPEKALLPPAPVSLSLPVRPRLHTVAAVPCSRCGEPVPTQSIPPAGSGSPLCIRCRGEIRRSYGQ